MHAFDIDFSKAGYADRQEEICISSSSSDLLDVFTYDSSGGLPAQNFCIFLVSVNGAQMLL